ncbi:MAG: hypothetical protein HRT47_04900 [Candidatus Caenarcaniphilales bacterium]|nr:hypothetical protein [Candidatus Caenarcaniphilales bacterium]
MEIALISRLNSIIKKDQKIEFSKYKSQVNDTDMAKESAKFTSNQIQQQTSVSMVTQANAQAQFLLSLLP